MIRVLIILFTALVTKVTAQEVAVLKYNGGGDWYSNPTALKNLIQFSNQHINTNIATEYAIVETGSIDIFKYPFIHMTGHGNVFFSLEEAENLRNYLNSGGFLHIDDNYGMDPYIKEQLKKVYPNQALSELPANHPIFSSEFNFPNGLPKIHEHDGKPPKAYGLFFKDRLVCLYTTESDLGDGWEDPIIHNNPESVRLKALQMGANIIKYAFKN